MNKDRRGLNLLIGLSTVGAGITGGFSFVAAIFALFGGELVAAGACFAAAGLAFGLLANAVLRE